MSSTSPSAANPKHGAASGDDPYLPGIGNGGYTVLGYDLDLDYRVLTNRLEGTAILTGRATQKLSRFSLDLTGLVASKVSVNGSRAAKFSQAKGKLLVKPATPLLDGQPFTVMIRYGGFPHPATTCWGEIGWEELADGVLVAGQPNGASTWFPCDNRASAKAPFTIRFGCDTPYRVITTGVPVSRTVRGHRTLWVFTAAEPVAPYLATVQVGHYTERVMSPSPVLLRLNFPPDLDARVSHDLAAQPQMLETFAALFGPYPFPEYTVVVTDDELDIPLEAHGLAVFGRNHIDGAISSERLIAHELAHQWFGNSLTAASWRDIWLHEGFACYAEWLWSESKGATAGTSASEGSHPIASRSADEHARHHWARLQALPQDLVLGDPGPKNMFDDRVYKRGALTLHALRLAVGDDLFFEILRTWTAQNRHGTVTTEDFVAHSERVSRRSLRPLFDSWVNEQKLPTLVPRLPRL